MTDVELGREALRHFHNASIDFEAYQDGSFDDLLALYGNKRDIYLEGVGLAIRVNGLSTYDVQKAMQNLAKVSQGRIPKDHQGYIKALGNQASSISYLDLTKTVAKEVGSTVLNGAVSVGEQVTSTLKVLNFAWPVALFAFLGLWYLSKTKSLK